jgi:DNA-binding CsgD family transcriptional regulator
MTLEEQTTGLATIKGAANATNVSWTTIRGWTKTGIIDSVKIPGCVRLVRIEDVVWLRDHRNIWDGRKQVSKVSGQLAELVNSSDLSVLEDRERFILKARLGSITLENLGIHLGLSRERVRQLEARAIKKLVQQQKEALDKRERPVVGSEM